MSVERFTLFEEAVQAAEVWLRELCEVLGESDPQQAQHLLFATLHALRDRLHPSEAVQLGAQLPALIRGLYYDGWRPAETPTCSRQVRDFLAHVAAHHHGRVGKLEDGVRAVFTLLHRNMPVVEALELVRALPEGLRALWPDHVVRAVAREERIAAH